MQTLLNEKILHSTALFDQAVPLLENKLAAEPNNSQIVWQLIENSRQQGRLAAAAAYSALLLEIEPAHQQAGYIQAILQERPPAIQAEKIQPVPFIRREDVLDATEQQQIWHCIRQHQADFKPSKVVSGNADMRQSRLIDLADSALLRDIKAWFLPKIADIIQEKRDYFAIPEQIFGRKELQLTLHGNQHYFKTHTDISRKTYTETSDASEKKHQAIKSRVISFVYYMHRIPKQFTGGELLLFDTGSEQDVYDTKHTRIMPDNNSLILFPSQYYHQVTPVSCATTDIEQGRFTLNGWFHAKTTEELSK